VRERRRENRRDERRLHRFSPHMNPLHPLDEIKEFSSFEANPYHRWWRPY
jgi:hypothetical protein